MNKTYRDILVWKWNNVPLGLYGIPCPHCGNTGCRYAPYRMFPYGSNYQCYRCQKVFAVGLGRYTGDWEFFW